MTAGNKLRFDGKVAIVTGAGAGLGRAYALLLASRGASVVVNDLGGARDGGGSSTKVADTVVDEIRRAGGKAVANYDNVLNGENIVKTAIDSFGKIDIVVNNAGILRDKSFMKMSDQEWDIIQDVHLKGAMRTTKAAWPYLSKQKYGKVIFTSSNSGLYGNFGQANYSSAKMGLVGLMNTLAIEGAKNNVQVNVIVPTAGSRLTEDIMPPDFFDQLKPELIAPIVAWLCHENCDETGSIIESAVGWAGKCHLIRSNGAILRKNIRENVDLESVRDNWSKITDMSVAKHYTSIGEVSGELLNVIEELKNSSGNENVYACHDSYDFKDAILYALSVGATLSEPSEVKYLYENHENFSVVPSFFNIFAVTGMYGSGFTDNILPGRSVDPSRSVHGEQYMEIHAKLPTEGKLLHKLQIEDVLDKGKHAIGLAKCETFNAETGEKLITGQMVMMFIGQGGFGGRRNSDKYVPTVEPPKRRPDQSISQKTTIDQAALYRLASNDFNPLHMDPDMATMGGFEKPILHGLCSLGFATRHVLQAYSPSNSSAVKALKVRFANPVLPGQTLRTDMWREGNRIHFTTSIVETNKTVIGGAYVDLHQVEEPSMRKNLVSGQVNLESDAVFEQIKLYVTGNPDHVKSVKGVFVYNITDKGTVKGVWTLDLKNAEVYKTEPKQGVKADTTLTIEDKDMIELALGKLNPQQAFMKGKLKIKGNIMLTQKLKTLMESAKSKL